MKIDKRQQVLAVAAVALVAFFVLDKLIISPMTQSWKERSTTIAELRKSIAQGRSTLDREQITRSRWNDMRRKSLPVSASDAESAVLQKFYDWARDSRISVSSIKPQWKRGATEDYSLFECRVDAAGSLATITRFLYEVEHSSRSTNSPMALKLERVEVGTRDNDGQQLTLGLTVTGLRLAPMEAK
jgi:hypothetical protein